MYSEFENENAILMALHTYLPADIITRELTEYCFPTKEAGSIKNIKLNEIIKSRYYRSIADYTTEFSLGTFGIKKDYLYIRNEFCGTCGDLLGFPLSFYDYNKHIKCKCASKRLNRVNRLIKNAFYESEANLSTTFSLDEPRGRKPPKPVYLSTTFCGSCGNYKNDNYINDNYKNDNYMNDNYMNDNYDNYMNDNYGNYNHHIVCNCH